MESNQQQNQQWCQRNEFGLRHNSKLFLKRALCAVCIVIILPTLILILFLCLSLSPSDGAQFIFIVLLSFSQIDFRTQTGNSETHITLVFYLYNLLDGMPTVFLHFITIWKNHFFSTIRFKLLVFFPSPALK